MVIDVTDYVSACIDEVQCPYEYTLSCLTIRKEWSAIDVTYLTTTAPVSNPYAVLASFYSELAEVTIVEVPIVLELLRCLV